MPYPISNTLKTSVLAGLVVLVTGLLLGNVNSSFAVEPMIGEVGDIEMWLDTREQFDDEATMVNNFLNVFTAAYLATDGNLEVMVLDQNTICISASPDGESCLNDETLPQNRPMVMNGNKNDVRPKILLANDP